MVNFDFVFGMLKWLGSVFNWFYNGTLGFFGALLTASPGVLVIMLIMLAPILVGIGTILLKFWKERSEE